MKKIILFFVILMAIGSASAEFRTDISVMVPAVIGIQYQGQNLSESIPFTLTLPVIDFHYFFGSEEDLLSVGIGARMISFIIVNAGSPDVALDLNLGKLKVRGQISGLYYFVLAGGFSSATGVIAFPDVNAHYYLTDWFAVGGGVLTMIDASADKPFDNPLPYLLYGSIRFSF